MPPSRSCHRATAQPWLRVAKTPTVLVAAALLALGTGVHAQTPTQEEPAAGTHEDSAVGTQEVPAATQPAAAVSAPAAPILVRSQTIDLEYRANGTGAPVEVELWYTRDRALTWQLYGTDHDQQSPLEFTAPAEGLYGFFMVVKEGGRVSSPPPAPGEPPQRWAFIDFTPPLVQWIGVEPNDDFANRRSVQLRWTSHDNHLASRPVSLDYQCSVDQQWQVIERELPNNGRYDWTVPATVTAQVTLRLTVRDRGGHVVERLLGPMPVSKWLSAPTSRPAIASAGAQNGEPTSRPALPIGFLDEKGVPIVGAGVGSIEKQRAEALYKQGSWHLVRGQYALAAERFREALEADSAMVPAMNDLAGIFYLQKDYNKAIELYDGALKVDRKDPQALRGAALAYVAVRQYPKSRDMLRQLLSANNRDAEALLDLGDVLFMMGDRDEARQNWGRATTVDAKAEEVIRKAKQRLQLYGSASSTERPAVVSKER